MKISIYTLGCKVNQYETQAMETELLARGYELVPFEEKADAYIINTCTVTAVSDKKSRQVIRRARKENPDAVIGVCGCYAQTAPEAVEALEVDLISGTAGRMAFLDDLEAALEDRRAAHLAGEAPRVTVDDALMGVTRVVRGRDLLDSAARQIWLMEQLGYRPPVYAHVPLLLAPDGRRLSKRERDLDMGVLRQRFSPEGLRRLLRGLLSLPEDRTEEGNFFIDRIRKEDISVDVMELF